MTSEWIEEFFEAVQTRGIQGLVPIEERIADFVRKVRANEIQIPVRKSDRCKPTLDFRAVAAAVGVPSLPLSSRVDLLRLEIDYDLRIQAYKTRTNAYRQLTAEDALQDEDEKTNSSSQQVTANHLAAFFAPLAFAWRIRDRLEHDPIGCNPFPSERSPTIVAKAIADWRRASRTISVPPLLACTLIDKALTWVLDYAPDIKRYVDELNQLLAATGGRVDRFTFTKAAKRVNLLFAQHPAVGTPGAPFPIWPRYYKNDPSSSDRPPFRTVLFEFLAAACMIVIAAFSARRHEELESLRHGCISYLEGEPLLETWIGKTLRDLDKIPVPTSVAKAIDVLSWLSSVHREKTGEPWLFSFKNHVEPFEHLAVGFHAAKSLARFSSFVGTPLFPDGVVWEPKPHQFRRFFGIVYYHRFRYPHLTALSNFYRHFDPDQTRRYVTEAARGGFLRLTELKRADERRAALDERKRHVDRLLDFDEEGERFRFERLKNVAMGHERISGWGGDALTRQLETLIADMKMKLDLSPEDDLPGPTFDSLISKFANNSRLEPNNLGHSYCKCSSEQQDLRSAACLTNAEDTNSIKLLLSAPDPSAAADHVCSSCPHNVQMKECAAYWEELVKHETAYQACALGPLLQTLSAQRLEMAQEHIKRCFDVS